MRAPVKGSVFLALLVNLRRWQVGALNPSIWLHWSQEKFQKAKELAGQNNRARYFAVL
jgi:hypothetical protein